MKQIEKDELYQHLSGFLKAKGIELKAGSYAQAIEKSCGLLSDAINLGQKGLSRAKVELDDKLDRMRQVIHEKTAPKSATPPPTTPPPVMPRPAAKSRRPNAQKGKARKPASRKK